MGRGAFFAGGESFWAVNAFVSSFVYILIGKALAPGVEKSYTVYTMGKGNDSIKYNRSYPELNGLGEDMIQHKERSGAKAASLLIPTTTFVASATVTVAAAGVIVSVAGTKDTS